MMERGTNLATCFVVVGFALAGSSAPTKGVTKADRQKSVTSLKGCVDQQDGQYVLVEEGTLKPLADLKPEGFEREGLAKHLGHTVVVRGRLVSQGDRPVMKVQKIDTASETCAPAQESKQR